MSFVDSLPDEALVNVSMFASESVVPTYLTASGEPTTGGGSFQSKDVAKQLIANGYDSYPAQTSTSQTKLYDAVGALASQSPASDSVFQGVIVVFTDGADTASANYTTPHAVTSVLENASFKKKVYALALGGGDLNQGAVDGLTEISNGRFFKAAEPGALAHAFDEVARQLGAIYLFKVLVASVESGAEAKLTVSYGGHAIDRNFEMSLQTVSSIAPGEGPHRIRASPPALARRRARIAASTPVTASATTAVRAPTTARVLRARTATTAVRSARPPRDWDGDLHELLQHLQRRRMRRRSAGRRVRHLRLRFGLQRLRPGLSACQSTR